MTGERGRDGATGAAGAEGATGAEGARGQDGITGAAGAAGAEGAAGIDGKHGHPATARQLIRVVTALVVIPLMILFYAFEFKVRGDLVGGCSRANVTRVQLYGFLIDAANTREAETADSKPSPQKTANDQAASLYRMRAQALLDSSKGLAVKPGEVEINCGEAFTRPWPF